MAPRDPRYDARQPAPGEHEHFADLRWRPREQHPAPSTWSGPHRISRCKVALTILGLLLAILVVCAGVDAWVAARVVS